MRYLLYVGIAVLVLIAPFTFVDAQLSSETYQVSGASIGGLFVSVDATSTSYAIDSESGQVYEYDGAGVDEQESSAASTQYGTRVNRTPDTTDNANEGQTSRLTIPQSELSTGVLSAGDSIYLCHADGVGYTPVAQNVFAFVTLHTHDTPFGHDRHDTDIIPPFFYDVGSGLFLYSGKNWTPQNEQTFMNDCRVTEASAVVNPPQQGTAAIPQEEVFEEYKPEIEEEESRLVYDPRETQSAEFFAPVGTSGLVHLTIEPGTFSIPADADETYRIFITVVQSDRTVSQTVRDSYIDNTVYGGPVDDSGQIEPVFEVYFEDDRQQVEPQQEIAAAFFSPDIDTHEGTFLALRSLRTGTQWRELSTEKIDRSLGFDITTSGVFSFWALTERTAETTTSSDEDALFAWSLQSWHLILLLVLIALVWVFILMRALRR